MRSTVKHAKLRLDRFDAVRVFNYTGGVPARVTRRAGVVRVNYKES